jgi:hypothetical protein
MVLTVPIGDAIQSTRSKSPSCVNGMVQVGYKVINILDNKVMEMPYKWPE